MSVIAKRRVCDMCGKNLPAQLQSTEYYSKKGKYTVKVRERIVSEDLGTRKIRKRNLDLCPECMSKIRQICVNEGSFG